ncbi:E3 ubiquitin-protein [Vigna angularis]|uniref:RING-type E3 ubiquitin transferase n=2 Tax=Phaseolus angularis TaxID=3914 RepID=A0A8T0KA70_PHAAN|nr:probable E3 ubiquitin-protein ligase ZFP1 [Vigna angularis]XP_017431623.1 probable E3 ubiquitin-protein ligase ZFP1 [Vigna angularis]XP_017431624.1 probable E3 ubiquitin-protein ligase ZFP1 [Vigna angularis]XP_052734250.1 probable E3 ubiquitin-protein ligase ZFP1 [Vigna angularis]BAT89501.1 hypothetical protein VIGAN_06047100 [Vigna angularis var. angularis]KAG2396697.1 E3 ubiquitin-protein [Vigna angularis]
MKNNTYFRDNSNRESMMVAHSNHFIRGNYLGDQHFHSNINNGDGVHALDWYHSLPMSYAEAPTAGANVRRRYNDRAGRRRCHRFLHRPYRHVEASTASANVRRRYNDRAGRRRCHRFQHRPYRHVEAPTASANVRRRYNDRAGRRRCHRFQHRPYRHAQPVQEIRCQFNFHSQLNRVPTSTNHSSSSMPIQNAPRRDNMHNHHPPAHREFPSYMLMDTDVQEFPSYMIMDTDDMSYETFSNVQEPSSLGDPHNDIRLDIDDMSYEELLELGERINDNSERGLSEDIIVRQMQTKSCLLPENFKDQEIDICIICQDEYKNKEEIGILQCGHEYHADCIKRWLHKKNVCPMCKSKALTIYRSEN